MGREAYLDKIAFGRSAFEPARSTTQSRDYVQLAPSQSELPRRYVEASPNNYIQLYDERGSPINPRAREYARNLRRAQNDVLASVGVIERQRVPAVGSSTSPNENLDNAENTVGNAIAVSTTISQNLCTWWIGSIRARVMAYRFPAAMPFTQIIAYELAASGASLAYSGTLSRLAFNITMQAIAYGTDVCQPLTRLLLASRASPRTRQFFRQTRGARELGLRWAVEVFLYPLAYHTRLQRLGLVPASLLLPAWGSFLPWSASSPLTPFSTRYDATASVLDCIMSLVTSPAVFMCAEYLVERWVSNCIHNVVESLIMHPRNTGSATRQISNREWTKSMPSWRGTQLIQNGIYNVLLFLGWGRSFKTESVEPRQPASLEVPNSRNESTSSEPIDVHVHTISRGSTNETARPGTPPTPRLQPGLTQSDPRIRITSREGVVEMEVRLPSTVLSTHTEVVSRVGLEAGRRTGGSHDEAARGGDQTCHHVSTLSLEPALMAGAIVKTQLIGLALVPLQMMSCRLVAAHFVASQEARGGPLHRDWPVVERGEMNWGGVGRQVSRVALCGALEVGIDLVLWSVQYFAVTQVGQGWHGWGRL